LSEKSGFYKENEKEKRKKLLALRGGGEYTKNLTKVK